MVFKVFAGNMYCGKLHTASIIHSFYPVTPKALPIHEAFSVAKVADYKKLTLKRVL